MCNRVQRIGIDSALQEIVRGEVIIDTHLGDAVGIQTRRFRVGRQSSCKLTCSSGVTRVIPKLVRRRSPACETSSNRLAADPVSVKAAMVSPAFFAAGKCESCEQEFFPEGYVKSNFLCNIGYGDPATLMPRGPRLDFNEACTLL